MSDTNRPVTSGSGEHPRAREAMNDIVRRAVNEGIPAAKAEKMAQKAARDYDNQNRK